MRMSLESQRLRQRADYTYKYNTKTGRHGWLRLTPAYSLKIVEELIVERRQARRIYDPFCGTGTTALSAAYHGREGTTTDINPFLIWLARAKTAHYSATDLACARSAGSAAIDLIQRNKIEPTAAPPLHNIERWWTREALDFLCHLRAAISVVTDEGAAARDLLQVAFCRSLITLSNAAFNHQSMSFKNDDQLALNLGMDWAGNFMDDVQFVLHGAGENPSGSATVILGDARAPAVVAQGPFDLIITSPPYVNRMSYIRELRPYMYWLGFLTNGRDAGELDWTAIGGTWGVATSRLLEWRATTDRFESKHLRDVLNKIAHADNKNGVLLANYVARYCDDIWQHLQNLSPVLVPGAEVHYIVGNSTFYGTLVSAELLYAEMLTALGFTQVEYTAIRKRNSKKELIEFDVTGKWKKA